MMPSIGCFRFLLPAALGVVLLVGPAGSQGPARPPRRPPPRLEPVAETPLLMEGLAQPNFRGLEKLLKNPPTDDEAWVFARGQALLIAETANLLMLRPPRNEGQDNWMDKSMALRDAAATLAKTLAKKDFDASRTRLGALATSCNSCHKAFKSPVKIVPFEERRDSKQRQTRVFPP